MEKSEQLHSNMNGLYRLAILSTGVVVKVVLSALKALAHFLS
jgi:hypothetical protein